MADATPRTYIYGIIGFVFVILAGLTFISPFAEENPAMVSSSKYADFNASFNSFSDVQDELGDIQTSITDASTDFGTFGVLNALVSTAWQSLKLLFTSLGFMNDAYTGMSSVFGVPTWIPSLIILVVVTMIAFTIWSAIFQSEL